MMQPDNRIEPAGQALRTKGANDKKCHREVALNEGRLKYCLAINYNNLPVLHL